jgi:predicted nucleic acid-binding protein
VIVISNSSPLIIFARLKRFDVLQSLFTEIIIPEEVYREVTLQGKGHPGALEVEHAKWILVKSIFDRTLHDQMRNSYNLGPGEVATIILAKEFKADLALIDEKKARILAKAQGLAVLGSV